MEEKDIILETLENGDYQLRFEPISVEKQAEDDGYQDECGLLQFKVILNRDLFEDNL